MGALQMWTTCRAAPQGDKAVAGQKAQPRGAKASNEKGEQPIGPKRGSNVSYCSPHNIATVYISIPLNHARADG